MSDEFDKQAREVWDGINPLHLSLYCMRGDLGPILDAISSALRVAAERERKECSREASLNWHSMKMLGSSYVDGACDAGQRIAATIRARGNRNDGK